jgi:hypothetical protein
MAKQKTEIDIEIALKGECMTRGGLDAHDLQILAELLKGLSAYDPSLKKIYISGTIKKGSSIVGAIVPIEIGLAEVHPARYALRNFFEEVFDPVLGWLWNKSARMSLEKIANRNQTLNVRVMPAHKDDSPFKKTFAKGDYESFSKKIAKEPEWRKVFGKILEIDLKDRTFEIHTSNGIIKCRFPEDCTDEFLLTLVTKTISAEVLCRDKPSKSLWRADKCKNTVLVPEQDTILTPKVPLEDEIDSKLAAMFVADDKFITDYAQGMKERYAL